MYLGQCMQLQSDNAHSSTANSTSAPAIVPFRQCKLTELLFSNSYPSNNHRGAGVPKAPQKAIMVVTADPLGDYNATSQILRYSALAREVTVPRIPSLTSSIVHSIPSSTIPRPNTAMSTTSGRSTPQLLHGGSGAASAVRELEGELQQAYAQMALLRQDLELQTLRLDEETQRRLLAEQAWTSAESRMEAMETDIREEVWGEMEGRLFEEQRRWRAARDAEKEDGEAFVDRKLDILTRGMEEVEIFEDEEPSMLEHAEKLEDENQRLREKVRALEDAQQREKENLSQRSPSKKIKVLKTRRWEGSALGLDGTP